jgi:hypothetical protein
MGEPPEGHEPYGPSEEHPATMPPRDPDHPEYDLPPVEGTTDSEPEEGTGEDHLASEAELAPEHHPHDAEHPATPEEMAPGG